MLMREIITLVESADMDWRTWWWHPSHEPIRLGGEENEHWHYAAQHAMEMGGADLVRLLRTSNVEDDWDARDRMKWLVYRLGWVRVGLVNKAEAYLDGMDKRALQKAALFVETQAPNGLTKADILVVPNDLSAYRRKAESESAYISLVGDNLERFLKRGVMRASNQVGDL